MVLDGIRNAAHYWFAPVPTAAAPAGRRVQDPSVSALMDEGAQYLTTAEGAQDLFRVFGTATSLIKAIPDHPFPRALVNRVDQAMSTMSSGFSVPGLFVSARKLVNGVLDVLGAHSVAAADPHRAHRIVQAYKEVGVKGLVVANDASHALIYMHGAKVWNLGQEMPGIETVFNGTAAALDGSEVFDETYALRQGWRDTTPLGNEKRTLSCLKIAKDVASIAYCVLALAVAGTTVLVAGFTAAQVSLGLGTAWLTLKLYCYFREKLFVEPLLATRPQAFAAPAAF